MNGRSIVALVSIVVVGALIWAFLPKTSSESRDAVVMEVPVDNVEVPVVKSEPIPQQVIEAVPIEPDPCDLQAGIIAGEDVTVSNGAEAIAALVDVVSKLEECDPFREYFHLDGRLRDGPVSEYGYGYDSPNRGSDMLRYVQFIAGRLQFLGVLFNRLPVPVRRQAMEEIMPRVASYAAWYLHPDHLNDWLLDLDWEQDIAPIDPGWYSSWYNAPVDWPYDRLEPVKIEGYGEVSKLDFWFRLFWDRRGEAVFNAAQQAVAEAM